MAETAGEREYRRQAALDAAIRVTGSWTRFFLVTRCVDVGLTGIRIFDSPGRAADAKVKVDDRAAAVRAKRETPDAACLFAGPDLATVIAHHPMWFDAPAEFVAAVLRVEGGAS